jgi:predicted acylesterase/phospholipase RssA
MKIALCLSGGGFRAMLFHLGVIRRLARAGRLADVVRIDSVSGGSILAAHVAHHWAEYCREGNAETVSRPLVDLAQRDLRGRIVRRRLLFLLCGMPLIRRVVGLVSPAIARQLRLRVTDLLEREYSTVYEGEPLQALCPTGDPPPPEIYLHTTSLTLGQPCAFAIRRPDRRQSGLATFLIGRASHTDLSGADGGTKALTADSVPIALAVAASSAFPPMFQPVELTADVLGDPNLPGPQALTDGGVFDNLGVHWQLGDRPAVDFTLVSDADGGLVPNTASGFRSILTRNIRSSDILMFRNAVLLRSAAGLDLANPEARRAHAFGATAQTIAIAPTDPLKHDLFGGPQKQEALRDVRTDLDAFSDVETSHLLAHGWAVADAVLREAGLVSGDAVPPPDPPQAVPIQVLRRSSGRRLGLWAPRDPLGMLYAAALALWLALAAAIVVRAWTRPTLTLTDESWAEASQVWFNEPSDLAATRLTRQGQPVLLGVDDEESAIFVLQRIPGGSHPGIVRVGGLERAVVDLEGLSLDGCTNAGVAITSHRRLGEDAVNQLIYFTLAEGWQGGDAPVLDESARLDLSGPLSAALSRAGVTVNPEDWKKEASEPDVPGATGYHPYAVEIEAIAYRPDKVTIGLKWPLHGGKALLWEYAEGSATASIRSVDLGGRGITGLAWVGDTLYIAANPPGKERKGVKKGPPFGQSAIYRMAPNAEPVDLGRREAIADGAKLEGLAVLGDELIGAFDGPAHTVRSVGPVHPDDRIALSWWRRGWNWVSGTVPTRCR